MCSPHQLVDALGRVQRGDRRSASRVDRVGRETRTAPADRRRARRSNTREVDAAPIEPRRRAGLQPAPREAAAPCSDSASSRDGGSPARPAGRCSRPTCTRPLRNVPVVTTSARQRMRSPSSSASPATPAAVDENPAGLPEDPRDVRLALERVAHPRAVAPLVGLRARRPHRRPAAAVEQLELDAGRVDRPPHQAAERVDLANQMPLRRAADRRIARHVRDRARPTACRSPTVRPRRAAAHAASTPACPAPMTMTSNACSMTSVLTIIFRYRTSRRSRAARRPACARR